MRDIKFRIWIPYAKIMMRPNSIQTIHEHVIGGVTIGQMKQWVYLQYTGWNDKNVEEIHEGDLISENGSKTLYEVVWQAHAGKWVMQSLGDGRGYREMAYDYAQLNYEVVGNIYENQELLDDKHLKP